MLQRAMPENAALLSFKNIWKINYFTEINWSVMIFKVNNQRFFFFAQIAIVIATLLFSNSSGGPLSWFWNF